METDGQTLPEVIDETAALLAKFVVPLYENDNRGRPSPHGSGVFVKAGGQHFLVSAAHVLETLKKRPLFYYVAPRTTRRLSGKLLLSPWEGDRDLDPIDVGVLCLSDEGLPPYPDVNKFAIDVSYLRPALLPRSGREYMILGYPASRSNLNPARHEVAATVYGFRNCSIEDARCIEIGLSPETHVILPLDLEVGFDSSGRRRNFPKPQGMSGSPIWVLFNETERDDLDVLPIVAIGTKYRKKERILVGTDVALVLEMINTCPVSP
jgi:hypothetical protein